MIIRAEQMEAFDKAALQKFEDEMVRHASEFSPKHAELIGETGVRSVVRYSMGRARSHGFTKRGPCRLYLDFVFMFGCDFDTDPQLPWTREILSNFETPDQMARAERLHEGYLAYIDAVTYEQSKEAFMRARRLRYEDLARPVADLESASVAGLHAIFPRKAEYSGEPALRQLTREAAQKAGVHSITSQAGTLTLVNLMFAMGHGCTADPQHPWVGSTLANQAVSDPNRRAERLFSKAMVYMDHVLAYLK